MGHRALLLGPRLRREDDGRVVDQRLGHEVAEGDHAASRRRAPCSQAPRVGCVRSGSAWNRISALSSLAQRGRACAASRGRRCPPPAAQASGSAGSPTSRRPRPFVPAGTSIRPAAVGVLEPERARGGQQRADRLARRARPATGARPRAPRRAGVAQRRRRPRGCRSVLAPARPARPSRSPLPESAALSAPRAASPGAGREAQRGRGVRVERARPARRHDDLEARAARGLAHAQVEDRRLVDQLGLDHEHRAGVVDVGHARGQVGAREHARLLGLQRAARGASRCAASRAPRA